MKKQIFYLLIFASFTSADGMTIRIRISATVKGVIIIP